MLAHRVAGTYGGTHFHPNPATATPVDRRFVLQPQPLSLEYDEFEKLLLGLALLQARLRKRVDAFDEVLGELLDFVYKKAGVLLETTQASRT